MGLLVTPKRRQPSTNLPCGTPQEIKDLIIILLILYGNETWSLTYRLGVFENTVLRKIFGLRTDEVTGDWRRLHAQ
jgi:hypothetical protein